MADAPPDHKAETEDAGTGKAGASAPGNGEAPIIIKKYANRRLYNTSSSSYVTLDYLAGMVKNGNEFVVHDAKTGEDITRQVLTQIIVEEESKGHAMLPIGFLRQLIRLYDDNMQSFVPGYLEVAMESFVHNQEQMREKITESLGSTNPFAEMENMARRNVAVFERSLGMFAAGAAAAGRGGAERANTTQETRPDTSPTGQSSDEISGLRDKLAEMQSELEALARKNTAGDK